MHSTARIAVAALAGACGIGSVASCGVGPSHTLNSTSVRNQIEQQLRSRYAIGTVSVSCPAGIAAKVGTKFSCTASFDGQTVRLEGEVTSTEGLYSIQPADAIVSTAQAVSSLEQGIQASAHAPVTVDCGSVRVRVVRPGGQFPCEATISGQGTREVTVTVEDLQGHVRYTVAQPSTSS